MSRSHASGKPSAAAVWAPWLAAPLFALLPIGGCGLAGGFRPTAASPDADAASLPPPAVTVVTVVTPAVRQVALGPTAH